MTTLDPRTSISQLVANQPDRIRVFERLGIDYGQGGWRPLIRACAAKGLDVAIVIRQIEAVDIHTALADTTEWIPATLSEKIDRIVAVHHGYLRYELPRLASLVARAVDAYVTRHPELRELQQVFDALKSGLEIHMDKEERVLFPIIKRLEAGASIPPLPNSVSGLIAALEREYTRAGVALERLRSLLNRYAILKNDCNSYQAILNGLAELEADLHRHIQEENHVLFPQTIAVEAGST